MVPKKYQWKISLYCTSIQKESIIINTSDLKRYYGLDRNKLLRNLLVHDIIDPDFLLRNEYINIEQYKKAKSIKLMEQKEIIKKYSKV